MNLRDYGITRAQLRQGSQGLEGGRGDDHFRDLVGSRDFYIYLTPNRKVKGWAEVKTLAEAEGCEVRRAEDAPYVPGQRYGAVLITVHGGLIPEAVLRKAHRWAHQRNFLHSFFKPYANT